MQENFSNVLTLFLSLDFNYWIILLATLAVFILGAVWYSPLMFGNIWMKINGIEHTNKEQIKRMQKESSPLYFYEFIASLVKYGGVAFLTVLLTPYNFNWIASAVLIWFVFFVTTSASNIMWSGTKSGYKLKQFLITISYQLVAVLIFSYIFTSF